MADIQITREHGLGLAAARKIAFQWAEQVEQEFDMECTYEEGKTTDQVSFTRSGVSGTLDVTATEFRILECLMRHADRVVSRTELMDLAWDQQFEPATNIIDVHISRIRRKVNLPGRASLIETVRGAGYRLRAVLPVEVPSTDPEHDGDAST